MKTAADKLAAVAATLKTARVQIPGGGPEDFFEFRELTTTERLRSKELGDKLGNDFTGRYAALMIMACEELDETHTEAIVKLPSKFLEECALVIFGLCGNGENAADEKKSFD